MKLRSKGRDLNKTFLDYFNYVMIGDICPAINVITGTVRSIGVVTVVTQWTNERLQSRHVMILKC